MIKFSIVIVSFNSAGKIDVYEDEADSLGSITRIMRTFKPKKGYKPKQYLIDEIETLF